MFLPLVGLPYEEIRDACNLVPRVSHLPATEARGGGGKMRDPGNEVVMLVGKTELNP